MSSRAERKQPPGETSEKSKEIQGIFLRDHHHDNNCFKNAIRTCENSSSAVTRLDMDLYSCMLPIDNSHYGVCKTLAVEYTLVLCPLPQKKKNNNNNNSRDWHGLKWSSKLREQLKQLQRSLKKSRPEWESNPWTFDCVAHRYSSRSATEPTAAGQLRFHIISRKRKIYRHYVYMIIVTSKFHILQAIIRTRNWSAPSWWSRCAEQLHGHAEFRSRLGFFQPSFQLLKLLPSPRWPLHFISAVHTYTVYKYSVSKMVRFSTRNSFRDRFM